MGIKESHASNCSYAGEYIILNFVEGNSYILGYIRLNDAIEHFLMVDPNPPSFVRFNEVLRNDFDIDENGLMTGKIPVYAMGDENGFYFQFVTLDGGHLDFDGVSELYFYSFIDGVYTHILDLDDNITHINGRNGIIVYNYYSVDNPNTMAGRIVFLNTGDKFIVPHITPVNDIFHSYIGDEYIYITSADYIIVFNIGEQSFDYLNLRSLSAGDRSNVRWHNNQFGWLCFYDDSFIVFYRVRQNRNI